MRIVYFIIISTFTFKISKNQGLTNSLADMNNVLGAKNLLPNNAESQTVNGVTFTVNSDGSITANGTASADTTLFLLDANRGSLLDDRGKSLVLSGRPTEGVTLNGGSCQLTVGENVNNTWVFHSDNGSGETFTLNSSRLQDNAYIWITSGVTLDNAVFKPMLRPASITDDTYVPYSMTNRELTDNYSKTTVRVISVKNTSGTWGDSIKNVLDAFRALTDIPDSDKVYIYDLQLSYMHLNVINAEYREFSSVRSNVKTYNCVGSNNNPKHILNAKIIDSGSSVELNRFSFEDSSLTNISSYTSQGSTSIHFLQLHNV